jgi:hypothetical protein
VSKPANPKAFFVALWISAIVLVAAALVAANPAKSAPSGHRSTSASTPKPKANAPVADHARLNSAYAALPLAFEANQGQADAQVKYLARGVGYKLYLTASEAIFKLHQRGGYSEVQRMMDHKRLGPARVKAMRLQREQTMEKSSKFAAVHMQLLGSSSTQLAASDPQPGKVNYFVGNDSAKWHAGVPLFGQVSYRNLYPGVDLAFHGSGKQLEFDYLVSPGADAKAINLKFQGADRMSTNAAGDLILTTAAGPLEIHRPVAYQQKDGARKNVEASFVVKNASEVAFALGTYDHSRELVIDPTVTYSTYFGGDFADYGYAIAVDGSGNEFVAGTTDSDTIPGDSNGTDQQSFDVFVTEITSAGVLVFTTEFGGSGDDFPGGIAIDGTGIYVAGGTDSSDFPSTAGHVQPTFEGGPVGGDTDAFAVKLALNGASLTWATYIAGYNADNGYAVAVDSSQNVYVVGETLSVDLGSNTQGASGVVNFLPNGGALNLGAGANGNDDGFIVKLNPTATAYLLVSYIGGSGPDLATGVALDGSGNIYISGQTLSTDLPVVNALQSKCGTDGTCNGGLDDAFMAGVPASLGAYTYLTYYGGSGIDDAIAIAVDPTGNAYVTGQTQSSDFPVVAPFQGKFPTGAQQNAFAVVLNPSGSAATYSTYLGGTGADTGDGVAIDSSTPANIYVTGQTTSTDFPTVNPTQAALSGSSDAFVTVLSPSQKTALFSTYLGGGGDEDQSGGAVAVDLATSNIYVTGDTDSGNGSTSPFPTTTGALDGTYGGGTCMDSMNNSVPCPDAFITAYTPATAADFSISAASPSAVDPGNNATLAVTLQSLNAYNSAVNLTCSVTGNGTPLPTCSATSFSTNPVTLTADATASTTLTVATTAPMASTVRPRKLFYALWLPIAGLSLAGVGLASSRSGGRKLLGFLIVGMVVPALILMPACGGGSGGGGGGGTCAAAPTVPTGLAATSTSNTGTTLNWTASTAGANCSISYTVYQGGKSIGTSSSPTFEVSGLTPKTTYMFTVAAGDSFGASAQSSPALSVTTLATGGTPAGTYTVTITGTGSGATHSITVPLVVN